MNALRKTSAFTALILLVGCAGSYIGAPTTADDIARGTQLVRDDFKKEEKWVSKFIRSGDGSTNAVIYLMKTGDTIFLQLDLSSQEWAYFHSVRDRSGAELPLAKVDSRVTSQAGYTFCIETLNVMLDSDKFAKARKVGLALKFYGQRHDTIINMPAFFFEGFSSAVEAKK
jgi:hypothetical protein